MSWLRDIVLCCKRIDGLSLCDPDPVRLDLARTYSLGRGCAFYSSLDDALCDAPDAVLNITPPHLHRDIVERVVRAGIPVLSEKPVALSLRDAEDMLALSGELGVAVVIAENYRFMSLARTVRKMVCEGLIGRVGTIDITFMREHHMTNYHADMDEPLLLDVSVHHLDMLRYITGDDMLSVRGGTYNPPWSHYRGNANAELLVTMTGGARVVYRGSLAARRSSTDWLGNWRLEGERGLLEIKDGHVYLSADNGYMEPDIGSDFDGRAALLSEFIDSIIDNRRAETDIGDNIKSFNIATAVL